MKDLLLKLPARTATLVLATLALACAPPRAPGPVSRPTPTTPTPTPIPVEGERRITAAAPLPPIPLVEGSLAPRVVFPAANAVIPVRDSNFIFGSVGNGHATLTING